VSISSGFEEVLMSKLMVAAPHVTIMGTNKILKLPDKTLVSCDLKVVQVQSLVICEKNNHVSGVLLRGTDEKNIPLFFKGVQALSRGKYPLKGEAIVGYKLAEASDIVPGDTISILTGPAVSTELKVSGIFQVGLYDFDSSVIIAPYDDVKGLEALPEEGMASQIMEYRALWLKDPFSASRVASNILYYNTNVVVSNWIDDNKSLVDAISIEKKVIFIVLVLLVVLVTVAISNSQFIQVLVQQEQIAVLSALGFTIKDLVSSFFLLLCCFI
jgi:lipoprotein-releasing system permease protein